MKKLLFLLLLAAACNTSKDIASSATTTTHDRMQVDVVQTTTEVQRSAGRHIMVVWDAQQMEERYTIKEYDPTVPLDSATGTRPVVRETTGVRRAVSTKKSAEISTDTSTTTKTNELVDKTSADSRSKIVTTQQEKKKTRTTLWWVWAVLLVVVIPVGSYLALFRTNIGRKLLQKVFSVLAALALLYSCAAQRPCDCTAEARHARWTSRWAAQHAAGALSDADYHFLLNSLK